jgi:hypothetical protein
VVTAVPVPLTVPVAPGVTVVPGEGVCANAAALKTSAAAPKVDAAAAILWFINVYFLLRSLGLVLVPIGRFRSEELLCSV